MDSEGIDWCKPVNWNLVGLSKGHAKRKLGQQPARARGGGQCQSATQVESGSLAHTQKGLGIPVMHLWKDAFILRGKGLQSRASWFFFWRLLVGQNDSATPDLPNHLAGKALTNLCHFTWSFLSSVQVFPWWHTSPFWLMERDITRFRSVANVLGARPKVALSPHVFGFLRPLCLVEDVSKEHLWKQGQLVANEDLIQANSHGGGGGVFLDGSTVSSPGGK